MAQTTNYVYNKLGQLQSTIQSDGTRDWVTSNEYDETGFLKISTDPGSNQDIFTRNKLKQIALRQDPNGNLINYVYDETGRSIIKLAGSTVLKNVYQFRPFGPTRQEETRNGTSFMTVYNDFNFYGSQTYKATLYDGIVSVVRHQYDDGNQLNNVADPFDYFTQYSYDKTRVSRVQTDGAYQPSAADNVNANYIYDPDGKVKSILYPKLADGSTLSTDYSYDAIGRLLKVTNKKGGDHPFRISVRL